MTATDFATFQKKKNYRKLRAVYSHDRVALFTVFVTCKFGNKITKLFFMTEKNVYMRVWSINYCSYHESNWLNDCLVEILELTFFFSVFDLEILFCCDKFWSSFTMFELWYMIYSGFSPLFEFQEAPIMGRLLFRFQDLNLKKLKVFKNILKRIKIYTVGKSRKALVLFCNV